MSIEEKEFFSRITAIRNLNGGITLSILLLAVCIILLIANRTVRPVMQISHRLKEEAEKVASSAAQIAGSGQCLAEGASSQAAAVEETAASLEQVKAVTSRNADHSEQARQAMEQLGEIVGKVSRFMTSLTESVGDIGRVGDETAHIIKSIDEIAFQTNLLALNAAVEAARAGEAGAGFAVVAEEVRNLALRSAEAARNTANMLEGSGKKISEMNRNVQDTQSVFSEAQEHVAKTMTIVREIIASSKEQAVSIGQISSAVSEVEKVVQQNSAGAQESASSSAELHVQAEEIQALMLQLSHIVGTKAHQKGKKKPTPLPGPVRGSQAAPVPAPLPPEAPDAGDG